MPKKVKVDIRKTIPLYTIEPGLGRTVTSVDQNMSSKVKRTGNVAEPKMTQNEATPKATPKKNRPSDKNDRPE